MLVSCYADYSTDITQLICRLLGRLLRWITAVDEEVLRVKREHDRAADRQDPAWEHGVRDEELLPHDVGQNARDGGARSRPREARRAR